MIRTYHSLHGAGRVRSVLPRMPSYLLERGFLAEKETVMTLRRSLSILTVAITALFSVSCIDLVVAMQPWFDVEAEALAEPSLAGSWCMDDARGDCSPSERMLFVRGPGHSWNVLVEGELRLRVWLGEINGSRYLDWMILCEPSLDPTEDDCIERDVPFGTHLVTQITFQQNDRIEFRLLNSELLADYLTHRQDPVAHGWIDGDLVVIADSDTLAGVLAEHGERLELWYEEEFVITRTDFSAFSTSPAARGSRSDGPDLPGTAAPGSPSGA